MQGSSNTTPTTSAILSVPYEIIFHIFHFLNPCEVIRLRLVSKQFNVVTHDARLWRTLYTNSRLPRPPGPFQWQSTKFLEHVLIHSARVSQTWTLQPISVASRIQGPRTFTQPSPVSTPFSFLFGRLFVWCEGEQLLAQDLETGVGRLLWEATEPISSLDACSLTLPDAERVFIGVRHVDEPIAQRTPMHVYFLFASLSLGPDCALPSKLLEFPLQNDVPPTLGPLAFEMDLPEYANFPLSASAPFLFFHGGIDRMFGHPYEPMVIDARTHATYRFPVFSSSLDAVIHKEPRPWWPGFTALSGGHVVVFRPWRHWNPPVTLIQMFAAPHLSDAKMGQLRLTHEVLVERCFAPTHCLRSATVNPATGEVNIRFLSADTEHEHTYYFCIDIMFPPINSESDGVLPMSVNAQELLVLRGQKRTIFLDTSDDGHGRGLLALTLSQPHMVGDYPSVVYKFSIDASEEHCTLVVSEPRDLTPQDVFQYVDCSVFDGVRGRFCHDVVGAGCDCYDLVVLGLR